MRQTLRRCGVQIAVAVAALLATGLGGTARAQEMAALDAVAARVKLGATIKVTRADGRELKGQLTQLSPSTLTVLSKGTTTELRAGEIRSIYLQKPKRYGRNALIGFAVGAGIAAIGDAVEDCRGYLCGPEFTVLAVGFCGALGAGVGVLFATDTPESVLVYELKTASSSVRFGVSPVATPARQGVILTVRF
jgi:hypothetical protein